MKSEPECEQKPSERARRGHGRGSRLGVGFLVAALMANGLACVSRARADAGMAGVERGAPVASRGELLSDGGAGAGEPSAVAEGEVGRDAGRGSSSGPLSEVTAAVSSANVQRLRDVARID